MFKTASSNTLQRPDELAPEKLPLNFVRRADFLPYSAVNPCYRYEYSPKNTLFVSVGHIYSSCSIIAKEDRILRPALTYIAALLANSIFCYIYSTSPIQQYHAYSIHSSHKVACGSNPHETHDSLFVTFLPHLYFLSRERRSGDSHKLKQQEEKEAKQQKNVGARCSVFSKSMEIPVSQYPRLDHHHVSFSGVLIS